MDEAAKRTFRFEDVLLIVEVEQLVDRVDEDVDVEVRVVEDDRDRGRFPDLDKTVLLLLPNPQDWKVSSWTTMGKSDQL